MYILVSMTHTMNLGIYKNKISPILETSFAPKQNVWHNKRHPRTVNVDVCFIVILSDHITYIDPDHMKLGNNKALNFLF